MVGPKPLLTEVGIHHRLESCGRPTIPGMYVFTALGGATKCKWQGGSGVGNTASTMRKCGFYAILVSTKIHSL